MLDIYQESFGRSLLRGISINIVFCTLIAIFLSIIGFAPRGEVTSFWYNFVFSQCVGNFCCVLVMASQRYLPRKNWWAVVAFIFVALLLGGFLGIVLAALLLGIDLGGFLGERGFILRIILGTLWFGFTITFLWRLYEKVVETKAVAQEEKVKRITSEKAVVETNLKFLQAQIEPHFLFNTLSNIHTLLDSDPAKGKSMLADLTRYLRTSLSKSRQEMSTVAQEMELICDYLRIYQVRMGERLRFEIDVPEHLAGAALPPMLVQPIVENAIKHGLEPKIDGGDITIRAAMNGENLSIEVKDTGLGFVSSQRQGTGLTNIKQRLKSLYAEKGRLQLEENKTGGLTAVIEIPYAYR